MSREPWVLNLACSAELQSFNSTMTLKLYFALFYYSFLPIIKTLFWCFSKFIDSKQALRHSENER